MIKIIVLLFASVLLLAFCGCQPKLVEGVEYYDDTFVPQFEPFIEDVDTYEFSAEDSDAKARFYTDISYDEYIDIVNKYIGTVEESGFKYESTRLILGTGERCKVDEYVLKSDKDAYIEIMYLDNEVFDQLKAAGAEDGTIYIYVFSNQ